MCSPVQHRQAHSPQSCHHITGAVQLRCLSVRLLDALHPSAKKGPKFYLTKSYGSPRRKVPRFGESQLSYQGLHGLLLQALGSVTAVPAPSSQEDACQEASS